MENRNIAAVVVTYNRLELLKQCVERLQRQTVPCTVWIVRRSKSLQPQCPGKVGKQMILSSVSISGL